MLILALYINSPDVKVLDWLPDFGGSVIRFIGSADFLLTGRGEMRQDPVILPRRTVIALPLVFGPGDIGCCNLVGDELTLPIVGPRRLLRMV